VLIIIKYLSETRFFWFLLLLTGLVLEGCGLYFQYNMNLPPCVNCVYERAYMLGFIVCGFVGSIGAGFLLIRLLCSLGFLATSIGGILVSFEHYQAYTNTSLLGSTCKLTTSFPPFLPLDEIAPFMFKATGVCSDKLDWEFLGMNMPFWVLFIFAVSSLVSFLLLLSVFKKRPANNYEKLYRR
jgi:disulfide bond formation protein DsbB